MATSNTTVDISELDFDEIKSKLINYLKTQETFTDYEFEGSALSTLMNILAYNTHYNAYYLNMVANEMFLDTAVKRSSVISHAKLLNYTPVSDTCSKAYVNITFNNVGTSSLVLPKYTLFYSSAIDNVNYAFVNTEELSVSRDINNKCIFNSVELIQGQPLTYTFTVNLSTNPNLKFKLPDKNIDTSTINIIVKETSSSTTFDNYTLSTDIIGLTATSKVYFLQESLDGYYEIYFGDGKLGKALATGNIITVEYLSTKHIAANGARKFTLMSDIGSYNSVNITTVSAAIGGKEKESISSIKYNAVKSYSSQGRAVTKSDYVNIIKNSNIIPIEAVSVWGGEELSPPQFGKLFIAIKPSGSYTITTTQKERLIAEVIKPISIVTVEPEIVDVNYTYIKLVNTILYNSSNSLLTKDVLKSVIRNSIINYCRSALNKFNAVFVLPDLIYQIKQTDDSIVSVETELRLTKKIIPILSSDNNFTLYFRTAIKKEFLRSSIITSSFSYVVPDTNIVKQNVRIEGTPLLLNSIDSITIKQAGSGYTSIPTIQILGDGTGATATATIVNGKLHSITITNSGEGYTSAVAKVVGGGGRGASLIVNLSGNQITLRSYTYENGIKVIIQENIGSLNYRTGVVKLVNFTPIDVENPLGIFDVTIIPESSMVQSDNSSIISLDELDPSSISLTFKDL